jgi:hypothetical protein
MRLHFVSIVLAVAVGVLSAFVGDPPSPSEIVAMLLLPAVIAVAATRLSRRTIWTLVLLAVAVLPAHAQAVPGTGFLDSIRPALADIAATLVIAIAGLAYERFRAWTGIQIEARHREALQSALANGARSMVENGSEADIMRAVDYVERSVPDALRYLKVAGRDRIRELLKPHVAAAAAVTTVVNLTAPAPARTEARVSR